MVLKYLTSYLHLLLKYKIIKIVRKQHWNSARVCDFLKRYRSWASVIWLHSRLDTWWVTLNTPHKWPDDHMGWRQHKYLCPNIFYTVFPSATPLVSPVGLHLKETERKRKRERKKSSKRVCSYIKITAAQGLFYVDNCSICLCYDHGSVYRRCSTLLLCLGSIALWCVVKAILYKCFQAGVAWACPTDLLQDGLFHHTGL